MSLRKETISGLTWSFVENLAKQGIVFIVGIVLARLLTPREFGLIGMVTVFIAVSESFVNSGFSSALIRKKVCTDIDYSTVFYFNITIGVLFFIILFFSAPTIGSFFNEPEIIVILQVLGVVLIIDSISLIQRTVLTKRIDFKLQARISIISSIVSGIVAVIMAYEGFGIWSLVSQRLLAQSLNTLFLWIWNKWRPLLVFSVDSFKELFGFGSKLLISGLIDTIYRNVYYLVIGKYFSAQELGFYTRANQFKGLPAENLTSIISRVTYPVLSTLQDDIPRLRNVYRIMIRSIMFVTFILMIGLASVSESMIYTLIGAKWEPSIIYLQMLCFVGMMYPLHVINLNMLQVQGRSDLFLKLEVLKKIIAIPVIVIAVFFGIKVMIVGMIIETFIAYYLNSYWSGKYIDYSFSQQVKDILPSFLLSLTMGMAVFLLGWLLPLSYPLKLVIQIVFGALFIYIFCEATKFSDYVFIRNLVLEKYKSLTK